jgi:hypothetical protein
VDDVFLGCCDAGATPPPPQAAPTRSPTSGQSQLQEDSAAVGGGSAGTSAGGGGGGAMIGGAAGAAVILLCCFLAFCYRRRRRQRREREADARRAAEEEVSRQADARLLKAESEPKEEPARRKSSVSFDPILESREPSKAPSRSTALNDLSRSFASKLEFAGHTLDQKSSPSGSPNEEDDGGAVKTYRRDGTFRVQKGSSWKETEEMREADKATSSGRRGSFKSAAPRMGRQAGRRAGLDASVPFGSGEPRQRSESDALARSLSGSHLGGSGALRQRADSALAANLAGALAKRTSASATTQLGVMTGSFKDGDTQSAIDALNSARRQTRDTAREEQRVDPAATKASRGWKAVQSAVQSDRHLAMAQAVESAQSAIEMARQSHREANDVKAASLPAPSRMTMAAPADAPAAEGLDAHSLPAPGRESTRGSEAARVGDHKTHAKPHAHIQARLAQQAMRNARPGGGRAGSVVGGARVGKKASELALAGRMSASERRGSCLKEGTSAGTQDRMQGAAALYFLGGTSTLQQQRVAARARQGPRLLATGQMLSSVHEEGRVSSGDQAAPAHRVASYASPLDIMLPGIEGRRAGEAKPTSPFTSRSPRPENQKLEAKLQDAIDNEDFLTVRALTHPPHPPHPSLTHPATPRPARSPHVSASHIRIPRAGARAQEGAQRRVRRSAAAAASRLD